MKLTPAQALLRAFVATLFFCSAPACVRVVEMNAYTLGVARLGMASLGIFALLVWQRKLSPERISQWSRRTWKAMLSVGVMFGLHWLLFFLSIKWASATIGAIGFSSYGIQLLLLGWMLGLGRITPIDVVGFALAILGTLLLVPEFSLANQQTLGLLVGIASGLAAATLPLLHQSFSDVDNNLRTWGQFTFGIPIFCIFYPELDWNVPSSDWLLILYLGFGIALVGHGLWIQAVTILSTTTTSILSYLYLPGCVLVNYLTIGELMTRQILVGIACVLMANALVLWNQSKLRAISANVPETT